MKNKKIFIFISIFFLICFKSFSKNFEFKASTITFDDNKNIIYGSKNVEILFDNGISISAENFNYDQNKKILKIYDQVKIIDNINEIKIDGEEFFFDENIQIIYSSKKVLAQIENKYQIETGDLKYSILEKVLSSKKLSKMEDDQENKFLFKEFIFDITKKLISSKNLKFVDNQINSYYLKEARVNTTTREIVGKDLRINFNNSLFNNKDNNPRLNGNSIKVSKNLSEINKGIFTTCKKNDDCPPWTLQAKKITHDKQKKSIIYDDALLKLYDLPVFYFPKFFHPDPTVKRQSGFLPPKFSDSSFLGSSFEIPYFKALAINKDMTLKPIFTTNKGLILNTEYREVNKNSNHVIDLSFTDEKFLNKGGNKKRFKNHFFSNSEFDLDIGKYLDSFIELDIQKVSNDIYLKSYDFNSPLIENNTTLHSKLNFTGINDDSSLNISGELYEDLSKPKSDRYEYILPNFDYEKKILTNSNIFRSIDFNSIGSYRQYDTNVSEYKIINDFTFNSDSFIFQNGITSNYNLNFKNLNYDTKNSSNFKKDNDNDLMSTIVYNSSLPLFKDNKFTKKYLTPRFSLRYSPNNYNGSDTENKIINIDNIYSLNRLSSAENVESGYALTIGTDYKIEDINQTEILDLRIAQAFRDETRKDLPNNNNIGDKRSDIIGRVKFFPNEFIDFEYSFSADNNFKSSNYDYLKSNISVNNFVTSFEFLEETNNYGSQGYWKNTSLFKFDKNNSISFEKRRNTKKDIDEYYNLIYRYENDCLVAALKYNKNFYRDAELEPSEELFFSISIIPFGETNSPNLKND